jgi:hypothetical protein
MVGLLRDRWQRSLLQVPVVPHLRQEWAHPCHVCAGTGLTPVTSAPGLGSPLPTGCCCPRQCSAARCAATLAPSHAARPAASRVLTGHSQYLSACVRLRERGRVKHASQAYRRGDFRCWTCVGTPMAPSALIWALIWGTLSTCMGYSEYWVLRALMQEQWHRDQRRCDVRNKRRPSQPDTHLLLPEVSHKNIAQPSDAGLLPCVRVRG